MRRHLIADAAGNAAGVKARGVGVGRVVLVALAVLVFLASGVWLRVEEALFPLPDDGRPVTAEVCPRVEGCLAPTGTAEHEWPGR